MLSASASLDNEENAGLTTAIRAINWPSIDEVYIAKQFIVVK